MRKPRLSWRLRCASAPSANTVASTPSGSARASVTHKCGSRPVFTDHRDPAVHALESERRLTVLRSEPATVAPAMLSASPNPTTPTRSYSATPSTVCTLMVVPTVSPLSPAVLASTTTSVGRRGSSVAEDDVTNQAFVLRPGGADRRRPHWNDCLPIAIVDQGEAAGGSFSCGNCLDTQRGIDHGLLDREVPPKPTSNSTSALTMTS